MIALRWTLGLIIALLSGGFLLLSIASAQFRKGFGASEVNPLITILPLVAAALLLAGLVHPASRPLLHAGAISAVALTVFFFWQAVSEAAIVPWFGVALLAAWLVFYWLSAWRPGSL